MSDQFTEITSRSWLSRIKSAVGGVVTGFLLLVAAASGLFWNEGRAVKTETALNEGAGLVMTIDPANPETQYDGKLVHFTGSFVPTGIPQDDLFVGITGPQGSTKLIRKVEMLQWKQESQSKTEKKLGGGEETVTTYSYSKVWSERPLDSSSFKQPAGHENPAMTVQSETFTVPGGSVGKIQIEGSDAAGVSTVAPLALDASATAILQKQFGFNRDIVSNGSGFAISTLPGLETVGDMRISFLSGNVDILTAVGKLENNKLGSFETSNGRKISMFRSGEVAAQQMFDDALSGNTMMTWGLRVAGFLAMLAAFNMMFSVIGVLGDVIPLVGDVFRFATGLAALALTAVLSTLIIGFAWIYFRPVVGLSIIAAGLVLAVGALVIGKRKASQAKVRDPLQAIV